MNLLFTKNQFKRFIDGGVLDFTHKQLETADARDDGFVGTILNVDYFILKLFK